MRRIRSSNISLPNKKKVAVVFVVAISVLGLFFFLKSLFCVKTITIIGIPAKDIVYGLSAYKNQSVFFIDKSEIFRSIQISNPRLRVIAVRIVFPSELIIQVQKLSGLAYITNDRGYYLLSEDARVMERVKSARGGVPVVSWYQPIGYDSYQPGDRLDFLELTYALRLLKLIEPLEIRIDTVDINGRDMIGLKSAGRDILISTQKDASIQVYQLGVIVKQFRIEGKDFKSIDLRFDKPTLVISN